MFYSTFFSKGFFFEKYTDINILEEDTITDEYSHRISTYIYVKWNGIDSEGNKRKFKNCFDCSNRDTTERYCSFMKYSDLKNHNTVKLHNCNLNFNFWAGFALLMGIGLGFYLITNDEEDFTDNHEQVIINRNKLKVFKYFMLFCGYDAKVVTDFYNSVYNESIFYNPNAFYYKYEKKLFTYKQLFNCYKNFVKMQKES